MKRIRKLTAVILSVLMIVSSMPITAFAYTIGGKEVTSGENEICSWEYDADTDTMYIDGDVITPYAEAEESEQNKLPVYYYNDEGERVYFSSDFKNLIIGKNVTALKGVTINCSNWNDFLRINNVTFEKGSKLREIGRETFYGGSIKSIDLPETVEIIDTFAFSQTHLEEITLPANVTKLGSSVFSITNYLKRADFSKTKLESIGKYTFNYSKGISEVILPSTLKVIEQLDFARCTSLHEITIPDGVETICDSAFCESGLDEISIPSSVTTIGAKAFADISHDAYGSKQYLSKAFIYNPDVQIAADAFNGVQKSEFTMYGYPGSTTESYAKSKGYSFISLYDYNPDEGLNDEEIQKNKLLGKWDNGTWAITDKALKIYGEGKMTSTAATDLNGRETTFAQLALENEVTSVSVENGITSIADCFMYIDKNTYIPTLSYVGLPDERLYTIGKYAFANTGIKWVLNNYTYDYAIKNGTESEFEGSSYICPDVTEIGEYAFANTANFAVDMILSTNLKAVSEGCFYSSAVKSVAMFGYVESIGKKAFANCTGLDSIEIPLSVKAIYENALLPQNNALGYYDDRSKDDALTIKTRKGTAAQQYADKHGFNYAYSYGRAIGTGRIECGVNIYTDENYQKYNKSFDRAAWSYYPEDKSVHIYPTTGAGDYRAEFKAQSDYDRITYTYNDSYYYFDTALGASAAKYDRSALSTQSRYTWLDVDTVVLDDLTCFNANGVLGYFNPVYVEMSDTIKSIGTSTFNRCTRLKSVNLSDGLTAINSKLFSNLSSLEAVNLGNGLIAIPTELFYNCKQLKFVGIGNSVKRIGIKAFCDCTSLQEIVIPDSVTTINRQAFYNCVSVQEVTIGSGVKEIGSKAFSNLIHCERLNVKGNLPYYSELKYVSVPECFTSLGLYTTGTEVVLGENVTNFDCNCFGETNITKITINSDINVWGYTFTQFPSLREIALGENCTRYYTYDNCLYDKNGKLWVVPRAKTDVKIDPACTAIEESAFEMSSVKTVDIPEGVRSIGAWAFADCTELKEISFTGNKLTYIQQNAFQNCTRLKTIALPESVKIIDNGAFEGCKNLASVILPEGLKDINEEAFKGCTSLKTVVLPESVKAVYINAFQDCTELEEVYIWNASFGSKAFTNCPKVHIYTMAGSEAYADAREYNIPYSAYTDEDAFFDECAVKLDALAGYLGICSDGHGDIQYLTVYENDCENDGYVIGVCEYCSEILEEVHTEPTGHSYSLVTNVPATASTRGIKIYSCSNCSSSYCDYTPPTSNDYAVESYTVSGRVVIAADKNAKSGRAPIRNCSIVIDGVTAATTDSEGNFTFSLETGSYIAQLEYAFGFTRTICIVVEDEDISCGDIPIIGCDFNKDGRIDDVDTKLFNMVISSQTDDPAYLYYVDMNNDGYINAKDLLYIKKCLGIDSAKYQYPEIVVKK